MTECKRLLEIYEEEVIGPLCPCLGDSCALEPPGTLRERVKLAQQALDKGDDAVIDFLRGKETKVDEIQIQDPRCFACRNDLPWTCRCQPRVRADVQSEGKP